MSRGRSEELTNRCGQAKPPGASAKAAGPLQAAWAEPQPESLRQALAAERPRGTAPVPGGAAGTRASAAEAGGVHRSPPRPGDELPGRESRGRAGRFLRSSRGCPLAQQGPAARSASGGCPQAPRPMRNPRRVRSARLPHRAPRGSPPLAFSTVTHPGPAGALPLPAPWRWGTSSAREAAVRAAAAGRPPPAECAVSRWPGSSRELPPLPPSSSSSRRLLPSASRARGGLRAGPLPCRPRTGAGSPRERQLPATCAATAARPPPCGPPAPCGPCRRSRAPSALPAAADPSLAGTQASSPRPGDPGPAIGCPWPARPPPRSQWGPEERRSPGPGAAAPPLTLPSEQWHAGAAGPAPHPLRQPRGIPAAPPASPACLALHTAAWPPARCPRDRGGRGEPRRRLSRGEPSGQPESRRSQGGTARVPPQPGGDSPSPAAARGGQPESRRSQRGTARVPPQPGGDSPSPAAARGGQPESRRSQGRTARVPPQPEGDSPSPAAARGGQPESRRSQGGTARVPPQPGGDSPSPAAARGGQPESRLSQGGTARVPPQPGGDSPSPAAARGGQPESRRSQRTARVPPPLAVLPTG
ncbi:skin secretory protein xP2-like [Pogoniulus pusillus]|uniref:skin secretory protein xP2-like n=1 Tax=Pogoniulus pusillus TaxID=488313 RepID=UPI0030B96CC5